ncbi:radical SAM protein [Ruegeria sp. HKCCA5014]|uniref:radical SAM protein n=1 Tax=Ruegeria sp. HKCCA5014 TaxID=2682980 RepID=UPI001489586E
MELVVKVANSCNLNCTYCYMYNLGNDDYKTRPVVMTNTVFQKLVERIREFIDDNPEEKVKLVFHGGEPLLLGARRLGEMVTSLRAEFGRKISLAVQTNGTICNDEIIKVFSAGDVAFGVSLDGDKRTHDTTRVDKHGKGSWEKIEKNLEHFARHRDVNGLRFHSVIVVANPSIDIYEMFSLCDRYNLSGLSILMPDTTIDYRHDHYTFSDAELSDWLIDAMSHWMENYRKIRIPLFNAIFSKLFGGGSQSESIGCSRVPAVIIESSGEITPHDVLRISAPAPEKKLFVTENPLSDIWTNDVYKIANSGEENLSDECTRCPVKSICGGGFLAHRFSDDNGFDNPSVWCSVLQSLIGYATGRVISLGSSGAVAECSQS